MSPDIKVVKAKLSDDGKESLKISVMIWACVSIAYLWIMWLLYVYWVFPMAVDFTKSYTAVTVSIFAVMLAVFTAELLIDTAQKDWWDIIEEDSP